MPSENEYLQSQIESVRHNLRLIEERKNEFVERTSIPIDLIKDEELQRERLEDLQRRLEVLSNPSPEQGSLRQPSEMRPRGNKPIVDREEERNLFRAMINRKTPIHILLMEAEGGMGKTLLLDQFWEISEAFKRARVDLKDSSYTMGQILGDLRDQYGQQFFQVFHRECRSLLAQYGPDVSHNALIASAMDMRLSKISGDELRHCQRLITKAFLADLESIREQDQPVVILFDEFQKVSEPVKGWITEVLIDEVRRYPWLICVITGRERPRLSNNDASWCLQHTLQPLSVQHRIEYIQKVKIIHNEELVEFITKFSKGNPYMLQQLVETLLEE